MDSSSTMYPQHMCTFGGVLSKLLQGYVEFLIANLSAYEIRYIPARILIHI